jgi:predicted transcriptional regulator
MDLIKEAFSKIKEDILSLKEDILSLKEDIKNIKQSTHNPTIPTHNPTIPTHNIHVQPLYNQNINSSIGNDGVPTNKPTNQQTNKPTNYDTKITINSDFKEVNNIMNSLDNIKKEIRFKFKRLTPQEMLVFSVLYELEEQNHPEITYRVLAIKINLSESSIRDYINKLINKGIPIDKIRQNNKIITLKISKDLKNIATLTTIQNLREL